MKVFDFFLWPGLLEKKNMPDIETVSLKNIWIIHILVNTPTKIQFCWGSEGVIKGLCYVHKSTRNIYTSKWSFVFKGWKSPGAFPLCKSSKNKADIFDINLLMVKISTCVHSLKICRHIHIIIILLKWWDHDQLWHWQNKCCNVSCFH
jgi:hypothetical protein